MSSIKELYRNINVLLKTAKIPRFFVYVTIDSKNKLLGAEIEPIFFNCYKISRITIYQGLVDYYSDNTEHILWVVAHELGHYVEANSDNELMRREGEFRADLYAAKLMDKAGFNGKIAVEGFLNMYKKYGDPPSRPNSFPIFYCSHPTWHERIKQIEAYYGQS